MTRIRMTDKSAAGRSIEDIRDEMDRVNKELRSGGSSSRHDMGYIDDPALWRKYRNLAIELEKAIKEKEKSLTASLDQIASDLERIDPRLALAVDQVSDRLEGVNFAPLAEDAVKKLLDRFKIKYHKISSEMRHIKENSNPWTKDHLHYANVNIEVSKPGTYIEEGDENADEGENYKRVSKLAEECNKHHIAQTFSSASGGHLDSHLTLSLNQREIKKLTQLSPR